METLFVDTMERLSNRVMQLEQTKTRDSASVHSAEKEERDEIDDSDDDHFPPVHNRQRGAVGQILGFPGATNRHRQVSSSISGGSSCGAPIRLVAVGSGRGKLLPQSALAPKGPHKI